MPIKKYIVQWHKKAGRNVYSVYDIQFGITVEYDLSKNEATILAKKYNRQKKGE